MNVPENLSSCLLSIPKLIECLREVSETMSHCPGADYRNWVRTQSQMQCVLLGMGATLTCLRNHGSSSRENTYGKRNRLNIRDLPLFGRYHSKCLRLCCDPTEARAPIMPKDELVFNPLEWWPEV